MNYAFAPLEHYVLDYFLFCHHLLLWIFTAVSLF